MTIFEIDAAYIGNTPVEKIYLGAEEIYEEGPSYRTMPLTIKALSGGTFYVNVSNNDVQVSFDSGDTWDYLSIGTTGITVSASDELQFAGMPGSIGGPSVARGLFSGNTLAFDVYGNIESLEYGTYVDGSERTIQSVSAFTNCFSGCTGLHSAENLILPATAFTNFCYQDMFKGCTSLTTAPDLLATTVQNPQNSYAQYNHMFSGCTSLNYIKCLAEDGDGWMSEYVTINWTAGVAATGTFVKSHNATVGGGLATWGRSADGIPPGWTVLNDDGTVVFEGISDPGGEAEW